MPIKLCTRLKTAAAIGFRNECVLYPVIIGDCIKVRALFLHVYKDRVMVHTILVVILNNTISGTAAEQAQYCASAGKVVSANALQSGDLIFWSYPNNPRVSGRFMEIGHVAIYVGNGMIIEAAPSAGCVTYRVVRVQGEPVM